MKSTFAALYAAAIACAGCRGDAADTQATGAAPESLVQTSATDSPLFIADEPWTIDVSGAARSDRSEAIIQTLSELGGWGNDNELQADFSIPVFYAVDRGDGKLYEIYQANKVGDAITAHGFFVWYVGKAYPENLRGEQCTSTEADAPPYGVRFRLRSDFDESGYTAPQQVIIKALKTHGMLLADGGEIALTFADDRTSSAKWADLGIDAATFSDITVEHFDVVELGDEIPLTYDCVRNL